MSRIRLLRNLPLLRRIVSASSIARPRVYPSWSPETRADVRLALWCSWMIVAAVGAALVVAPYVLAPAWVQDWVGICPAKAKGDPCSFCGMTTAFYLIAGGRFDEAMASNHASVPLYSSLAVNAVVSAFEGARKWRRTRRQ